MLFRSWITPNPLAEVHKNVIDKTLLIPPLNFQQQWQSLNNIFQSSLAGAHRSFTNNGVLIPPFDVFAFSERILAHTLLGSTMVHAARTVNSLINEPKSHRVIIEGVRVPGFRIGAVNGMNTSREEAIKHLEYIQKFTNGMAIHGVYNHSNQLIVDALEIFFLNYGGAALVTKDLLIKEWTQFHEENRDNPNAKYFWLAYSMGTILTRNALLAVPQEIRNRVIVVSIGPAIVIPEGLCYQSISYASKRDKVHWGENIYNYITALTAATEDENPMTNYRGLMKNKEKLIFLEPAEGSNGLDHDFESPTFAKELQRQIEHYLNNGFIEQ